CTPIGKFVQGLLSTQPLPEPIIALEQTCQLAYISKRKVTNSTWDRKERRNRVSISESFWQKPTAEERLSNTAKARAFLSKVTLRTPFSTSRKARSSSPSSPMKERKQSSPS